MTNLYGFETTEDVKYDAQGLPVGIYKAMIIGEEAAKEDKGVVAEYEVVSGEHKGQRGKVWYLTLHDNPQTANIAKQAIKRIADATGKAVSEASPLKGRALTLDVKVQKKDERYTEVKRYLPENYEDTSVPF